jgi:hypothetical protein
MVSQRSIQLTASLCPAFLNRIFNGANQKDTASVQFVRGNHVRRPSSLARQPRRALLQPRRQHPKNFLQLFATRSRGAPWVELVNDTICAVGSLPPWSAQPTKPLLKQQCEVGTSMVVLDRRASEPQWPECAQERSVHRGWAGPSIERGYRWGVATVSLDLFRLDRSLRRADKPKRDARIRVEPWLRNLGLGQYEGGTMKAMATFFISCSLLLVSSQSYAKACWFGI